MKRKPSWDFSVPGLMYSSVMMFMGIAAMNTQANLLFGVFGLMIGVLLISGVISRLVLVKLTVRRNLPDAAVVGQPATVVYEFENSKRFWPSLSVQVAELDGVEAFRKQPFAYLLHAARASSVRVPVEVMPKRRGVYPLKQYQIATSFPFGFVKRALVRVQDDSMLVFPALARVDTRVLRLLRSAETAGVTVKPRRGGEDEVFGLKEYRQGENPKLIHWRRSAQTLASTGQLVVREMTRVSPPRLMIVVDTRLRGDSIEEAAMIERTIAVAASLASEALEQGLMVGLVAVQPPPEGSSPELPIAVIDPNRGKRHRKDILTALARLPINRTTSGKVLLDHATRHIRSGTTPVVVTPYEMEQGLAEQARGAMVVLVATSNLVQSYFQFSPGVDFEMCMPVDQFTGPSAQLGP